jgi:molecular chaperone GrpE
MEKMGVKEIPALGEKFDPNVHNAVMHVDDESFGENEVVEVFMKGYARGDKVLRYSMVKVAN